TAVAVSAFSPNGWIILEHIRKDGGEGFGAESRPAVATVSNGDDKPSPGRGLPPGRMADIRAAAPVARAVRRTIMSGYQDAALGNVIPPAVSGHEADGSPTRDPHMAVVPLAFAGLPHADGRLLGFALVPPRGQDLLALPGFRQALAHVAPASE